MEPSVFSWRSRNWAQWVLPSYPVCQILPLESYNVCFFWKRWNESIKFCAFLFAPASGPPLIVLTLRYANLRVLEARFILLCLGLSWMGPCKYCQLKSSEAWKQCGLISAYYISIIISEIVAFLLHSGDPFSKYQQTSTGSNFSID